MALLAVIVALVASLLITRSIAHPLADLSRTATQIASGDRDARAQVERHDEIGALSNTFNQMVENIQHAAEALRDSEERYRRLADNAKDVIYRMALPDGRYEYMSLASLDLFGYSPDEFYNSPLLIWRVIHPEWHAYFKEQRENLIADNMPPSYEYQIIHKSGETRWMHQRNVLVHDDNGHPIAIEGIVTDITEHKRSEEELREYRDHLEELVKARTAELEQEIAERRRAEEALQKAKQAAEGAQRAAETANRAKSTFLANISHELRTPLNAILGLTQVMQRAATCPTVQRENLDIIYRSGEHLLELINDVLEMSKIEAGRITLDENRFDLYRMLDDLEAMLRPRAIRQDLPLTFGCASDVPQYIQTDERKLRQVLLNLLGNALKFTEQGHVTLTVKSRKSQVASRESKVASRGDQTLDLGLLTLDFEVSDTGSGIAPEEMSRLFEPFMQTASGQRVQQGTGLGLPISRQFVQLMGGDISMQSGPGQGSTFTFDIRVRHIRPSEIQERIFDTVPRRVIGLASSSDAENGDYRILVVDDDFESRSPLRQLLEQVGFTVQEAVNGQDAIEQYADWQPHLILMDMRMPVLDGYAATRYIRRAEAESQRHTPIIAVTAGAFEEQRGQTQTAGCDDFLRKPFREAEVFGMLHENLDVQYVYEDVPTVKPPVIETTAQASLTRKSLRILPADLVTRMREVTFQGRLNQLQALVLEVARYDNDLAAALRGLANRYAYAELFKVLEE